MRSSIIIPVYNQAALTAQCLDALVGTVDAEIIVADDGSTDWTGELLGRHEGRVRVLTHLSNQGFACSCNDAAALATGEFLVFLNNDTIPQPGWLEALEAYADGHAEAAVIGSKLLYPDGTVQHAGVVICQDRYPRHIYAGFPGDHRAVNKSRRFSIVTAASMLIRRAVFGVVDGFDTGFRNGFEDVDLCLRLAAAGHEIHYCAESVVSHLESVSEGRFRNDRENVARYRDRWFERVQPNDLAYYIEDGLLQVRYEGRYPLSFEIAPELAVLDGETRTRALEALVQAQSRHLSDLARENTKLTIELSSGRLPSPGVRYQDLRKRIIRTVQEVVPVGAVVLVASKGDGLLLELPGRTGWHFPQNDHGVYAGHYPADDLAAISHVEALVAKGATYLLFPRPSLWWLEHYHSLKCHLERTGRRVFYDPDIGALYQLQPAAPGALQPRPDLEHVGVTEDSVPLVKARGATRRPHSTVAKRRVLYVCHNHPKLAPGGAEVYALELHQAMHGSESWRPMLLARAPAEDRAAHPLDPTTRIEELEGAEDQFLFRTRASEFDTFNLVSADGGQRLRLFGDFLAKHRPDVVHFQHAVHLGYDFIPRVREVLPKAAIVHTLHEYLPLCHRNGQMLRTTDGTPCTAASAARCHECFPEVPPAAFAARKAAIQSHLQSADALVAPSRFLLDRYVDWGIDPAKIHVEEYGRNRIVRPVDPSGAVVRNRFGFFGQLNPFKGIDVLLKAMGLTRQREARPGTNNGNQLASSDSTAPRLWIHGANLELQPGAFRESFRDLLDATTENVTFVGPYDRSSLGRLMTAVDWVVVPSVWWENSPLVIQEAFAHGRPVICSGIGAMAEKVRNGVNGLHFKAGDPVALCDTLWRAASSRGLWSELVAGIPELYPMEKHIDFLDRLYWSVLQSK